MVAILVGAALGFLSGLGVGGGSLLLLWLTVVMDRSQDMARAMNLLFFLPCAFVATAFRWKQACRSTLGTITVTVTPPFTYFFILVKYIYIISCFNH